jgi:hypothetical protein
MERLDEAGQRLNVALGRQRGATDHLPVRELPRWLRASLHGDGWKGRLMTSALHCAEECGRLARWLRDLRTIPIDAPYFSNGMFHQDCHNAAEAVEHIAMSAGLPDPSLEASGAGPGAETE